jgi:hypothetical protein
MGPGTSNVFPTNLTLEVPHSLPRCCAPRTAVGFLGSAGYTFGSGELEAGKEDGEDYKQSMDIELTQHLDKKSIL